MYHTPNRHIYPDKYAHDLLFLLYPLQNELELFSEHIQVI